MMSLRNSIVGAALTLALTAAAAGESGYVAIILNDSYLPHSIVRSSGDSQQVGWTYTSDESWDYYGTRAYFWSGSQSSGIDLTPNGFDNAKIYSTDGSQQGGYGSGPATSNLPHALLWRGTAASYLDLQPQGFVQTGIFGVGGGQQVGFGVGPIIQNEGHALLWRGSAESWTDINPAGMIASVAYRTNGRNQVGFAASMPAAWLHHSYLWSGSAETAVDLTPAGARDAEAYGLSEDQQVGYVDDHAALWFGSAESYVDLNPSGFSSSVAYDTNGTMQVGDGTGPGAYSDRHALLWNGSAESYIDLARYLPYYLKYENSTAYSIAPNGDISGEANGHAVVWKYIPLLGDFDGDGRITSADIDDLYVHSQTTDLYYDLSHDGFVYEEDVDILINRLLKTQYGDANLDGRVNFLDFQVLLDSWHKNVTGWAAGDFDASGSVDFVDFQTVLGYWSPMGGEAAATVPEPATVVILLAGGLGVLRRFGDLGTRVGSKGRVQ